MRDKVNKTDYMINDYLKSNNILLEKKPWEIRLSALGGRGIFATRDIYPGELIFIDLPLIIGPRSRSDSSEICVICYKNFDLRQCAKNCGLPVCSQECQDSDRHRRECVLINSWKQNGNVLPQDAIKLSRCLTPIRSLLLNDTGRKLISILKFHADPKHGFEVDLLKNEYHFNLSEDEENFMRFVCSILDANAFEVSVGNETKLCGLRGVYPLASLANHNCSPNSMHVFDSKQRMIVKASVFIQKDSEIFHSYARIVWGTLTRRYHLYKTKHFACSCERCCDPSEFGGNLSGLACRNCRGVILPTEPLKLKCQWRCTSCDQITPENRIAMIISVLGSRIKDFEDTNDPDEIFKFVDDKLDVLASPTNQITVELKYKLVWMLGYTPGYLWEELSVAHLQRKELICRELLDLLWKIRTGKCKMRGLLLYEMYRCLKEKQRRGLRTNIQEINNNSSIQVLEPEEEMKKVFEEATNILTFDVGAPQEIKDHWPKKEALDM